MPIGLKKVGVGAGVGVIDIITEEVDAKQGYTKPFQNITDWARVLYTGGGYVANHMGYDEDITEPAVISGLPLLEKTVWQFIKHYTGISGFRKGRLGLRLKDTGDKVAPQGQTQIRFV